MAKAREEELSVARYELQVAREDAQRFEVGANCSIVMYNTRSCTHTYIHIQTCTYIHIQTCMMRHFS